MGWKDSQKGTWRPWPSWVSLFFFSLFHPAPKGGFFPPKGGVFPPKVGGASGCRLCRNGVSGTCGSGELRGHPGPPPKSPPCGHKVGDGNGEGQRGRRKGWAGSERGGREGVGGEDWGWGEVARGDFGGYPKKKKVRGGAAGVDFALGITLGITLGVTSGVTLGIASPQHVGWND